MEVLVTTIDAVRELGDNLTIVTVGEHEVVANKDENGNPRWITGELVIYVPEGAIVPEDVLKERGYWDNTKDKGLLEGKKGNRVKMRRFAGVESRGLLFKVGFAFDADNNKINVVERDASKEEVCVGDDVADFLGITERVV